MAVSAEIKAAVFTTRQVAEAAAISPMAVRRLVRQGRLRPLSWSLRSGRRGWRFSIAEVNRLLEDAE